VSSVPPVMAPDGRVAASSAPKHATTAIKERNPVRMATIPLCVGEGDGCRAARPATVTLIEGIDAGPR
jgi:hypothetical protein